MKHADTSPAVQFLMAAQAAMPSTIGDRMRIVAMSEAMEIAVRCRFKFNIGDEKLLDDFGIRCQVGVFRPMDYYAMACQCGGTYAKMWEAANKTKPWMASRAIGSIPVAFGTREHAIMPKNRVADGMGVLINCLEDDDEPGLQRFEDAQVWWVTSVTDREIVICRYRKNPKYKYRDAPFNRCGSPAKRRKLTRQQWEELQRGQDGVSL